VLPGYAKVRANGIRGLVIDQCHAALDRILAESTLYEYAASQPEARRYAGRAVAYGISLGDECGNVVVRHAMRGGALAKTGTDLFLPPTRGLRELINSMRLRVAGVPTPEVVAFVTYRAGLLLRRSDVATREIPESHDLSVVLKEMPAGEDRDSCLRAAAGLLGSLARAGAHHPDLNARNILVTWDTTDGARAHVLDVDRIRFHIPGDPMVSRANAERLQRSLRKLRALGEIVVSDREIELVAAPPAVE